MVLALSKILNLSCSGEGSADSFSASGAWISRSPKTADMTRTMTTCCGTEQWFSIESMTG